MATTATITQINADESAVRDLVQRYKICWEVWPEWIADNAHLEKTGFELELIGTDTEGCLTPGCLACVEVYNALRQVADFIAVRDQALSTRFEIEPFEPALRYSTIRHNRPDVVLDLKILHRCGLGPIDEGESCCLQRMQNKLNQLGAYRGRWEPDPDYPSHKYKEARDRKRH